MSASLWERGYPETPMARVMVVVPDAEAIRQIAGSLGYLAARKHPVTVGVQNDPPGAPWLGRFDGGYPGLSIMRLPMPDHDGWEAGARGVLQRHEPHLLVVARLRGEDAPHRDYVRAARRLGIPCVYLALQADDVAASGFASDLPDCIAVWNRPQRREAVELGLPVRRTSLLGAHLWTDVLEARAVRPRDAYCHGIGADPAQRLVVVAPPRHAPAGVRAWMAGWEAARRASTAGAVRDATVVLFTRTAATGSESFPGVAAVISAGDDLAEQHEASRHLDEALAHADALVTADATLALEGLARLRPVIALTGHAFHDSGDGLTALASAMRQQTEWPWTAASAQESVLRLARVLDGTTHEVSLDAARAFVRVHGDEVEPGFLLVTKVMRQVVPHPTPSLAPDAQAAQAAALRVPRPRPQRAPRQAAGPALFAVALPQAALGHWRALLEMLVERGHRVAFVAESQPETAGSLDDALTGLHGVFAAGVLPAPVPRALERGVAAVDLRLPELSGIDSPTAVRWRRRVEDVALPGWVRGVDALAGRHGSLARVRQLRRRLDRSLAPSAAALDLIDRQQPDALVLLPGLDSASALDHWAAHLDLARAARIRGVRVALSQVSDAAVEESLAQGAMRPNGVSRAQAAAISAELERWLDAPDDSAARPLPRAWTALLPAAALGALVGTARARRALERATRPARKAIRRVGTGAGSVLRRSSRRPGETR